MANNTQRSRDLQSILSDVSKLSVGDLRVLAGKVMALLRAHKAHAMNNEKALSAAEQAFESAPRSPTERQPQKPRVRGPVAVTAPVSITPQKQRAPVMTVMGNAFAAAALQGTGRLPRSQQSLSWKHLSQRQRNRRTCSAKRRISSPIRSQY
jgi:hypothetical protein